MNHDHPAHAPPCARYHWHPFTKRRYAFAVGAVGFAGFAWLASWDDNPWPPRVISLVIALVSLGLLIEQDTIVDGQAGLVIREGRLFGRILVWRRHHPLRVFTEVALRRQHDPEGNDTVFAGLHRRSGRPMAIRYFFATTGQPCCEAERFAQQLSETTRLPWNETPA